MDRSIEFTGQIRNFFPLIYGDEWSRGGKKGNEPNKIHSSNEKILCSERKTKNWKGGKITSCWSLTAIDITLLFITSKINKRISL